MAKLLAGKYRIIEELGRGGMGVVYRAEDTRLKRHVALKVLAQDFVHDPEAKERFIREAQAASALDHPNICTIYEIGESDDDSLFIAMSLYEGETLQEKIDRGPLEVGDALDIGIQMARGLAKAHEKDIVHRDIKSSNIIITSDGVAKIVDFGLAKLADQPAVTSLETVVGTAVYMSPEQARGEEADHRADIWSLGVVLYQMLTGKVPFEGDHVQAVLYSVVNTDHKPINGVVRGIPERLERIVDQALSKDPESRHQNAAQIAEELLGVRRDLESLRGKGDRPETEGRPSIAVLPFTNLSADPEQEYFCDGMAEELINALTHVEGLRVVARTSSFVFRGRSEDIRGIGRKLNVDKLLEGSVRKAGNRLRITAQLINVSDGYHIWSEKYDRDMEDVFGIQDEISLAIVDMLKISLLGGEHAEVTKHHTENAEAYNLYLKGRYFWNKRTQEGLARAAEYFKQALEVDPSYALAYAGLADAYVVSSSEIAFASFGPGERQRKAREAVHEALRLDDSLAEAHASLGVLKHMFERDLQVAEEEYRRAIDLNPGYASAHQWLSRVLLETGRWREAQEEAAKAQELDPLSSVVAANLALTRWSAWDWEGAEEAIRQMLELDPRDELAHLTLGWLLIMQGRVEGSIAAVRRGLEFSPTSHSLNAALARILVCGRLLDEAVEQGEMAIQLKPPSGEAHLILGEAYLAKGRYQDARAQFLKGKGLFTGEGEVWGDVLQRIALAKMGKVEEATHGLEDLEDRIRREYISPMWTAGLYVALGDLDAAFELLELAYQRRDQYLPFLKFDPIYEEILSHPRCKAMLQAMRLE